jgi:hypothetical protein
MEHNHIQEAPNIKFHWDLSTTARVMMILKSSVGLTDWVNDWLTDWLTHQTTEWLSEQLTDWLTDWQTDWLTYSLTDLPTDQISDLGRKKVVRTRIRLTTDQSVIQTDWLTDWVNDWLTDWLTDWTTDWQTDWLTYWLTDLTTLMAWKGNVKIQLLTSFEKNQRKNKENMAYLLS